MSLPTLDALATGRDNNLNLIRVVAALMVLVSHSFVLSTGDVHQEPWTVALGMAPGGLAVDIFFVVSGFLVTGSLQRSGDLRDFAASRALRVYPALWVALLVSTLLTGLTFTGLRSTEFFLDPGTWKYLAKNAVMITGAEAELPGAFLRNPWPHAVNGSLWTLRHELRLYALLGLIWLLVAWLSGRSTDVHRRRFATSMVALATMLVCACAVLFINGKGVDILRLGAMFFSGASYQVLRRRVVLNPVVCMAALLILAGGAWHSPNTFNALYVFALPYLVLCCAYWPNRALHAYNRVGDYSYGIYIYAFPVQQMLMASRPQLGIWELTAFAVPLAAVLAGLSWHLIEQPALRRRHLFTARVKGTGLLSTAP